MGLIKSSVIVFLGVGLAKLVQLIAHAVITNFGGAEVYGQFSIAFTLVTFFSFIGLGGLHTAILKYTSTLSIDGNPSIELKKWFWEILTISLTISVLSAVLLVLVGKYALHYLVDDKDVFPVLLIMALTIPVISTLTLSTYLFRAYGQFWQDTLIRNALRGGVFLAGLLGIVIIAKQLDSQSVGFAFLFSFIFAAVVALIYVYRFFKTAVLSQVVIKQLDNKKVLKYGLHMTQGLLAYEAMLGADKIMMGFFRPIYEVGQYSVAALLARQLELLGVIAISVLMPKLAEIKYFSSREYKTVLMSVASNLAIGFLGIVILYFLSPYLLGLMGKEFASGYMEFIILSIGFLLISMSSPFAAFFAARGREKLDKYILIFGFIINVLLLFMLVPVYGGMGAAASTMISLSFVFFCRGYFFYKHTRYCKIP